MSKKEKSLEEITKSLRKSIKLPEFEPLSDFETKIKRIARTYGGDDTIHQEGSHKDIKIEGQRIHWSSRQRGHENILSPGVFKKTLSLISEATSIPYEQLELYFKGGGQLYGRYKRRFEEEYDL